MQIVLPYIQILLSILIVALVLLQQRGSSLGGSFGGDSATYNSRRGAEKWLFRATILLGMLFVASTLAPLFLR
ncbi:MAG: preprotein translocase subunit SecG [Patescibacteria group bacterium]